MFGCQKSYRRTFRTSRGGARDKIVHKMWKIEISQFRRIHFMIETNTFCNWTKTSYDWDKYKSSVDIPHQQRRSKRKSSAQGVKKCSFSLQTKTFGNLVDTFYNWDKCKLLEDIPLHQRRSKYKIVAFFDSLKRLGGANC